MVLHGSAMNSTTTPRRRAKDSSERTSDVGFWPKIIAAVKGFHGLCALAMLVSLALFSVIEVRTGNVTTIYAVLVMILAIVAFDLLYIVRFEGSEVIFRVRLKRARQPLADVKVTLHKNQKEIKSKSTDEEGEVSFRIETPRRGDELYVTVNDSTGASQKAALYSEGQLESVRIVELR